MEKTQGVADYVRALPAAKPLPDNWLFAILKWCLDWNYIQFGVKKEF